MSTLSTTYLKNSSSSVNNVILNTDGGISGACVATQAEVSGTHTTGTIISGTTALTVASATGITLGSYVVGQGVTPGTTVSSIVGTSLTLSQSVNATLSAQPVSFYTQYKLLSPGLTAGQLCRAWVRFESISTPSILSSYNVSSITDSGTGNYGINFTTAMPDNNYIPMGTVWNTDDNGLTLRGASNQGVPGWCVDGTSPITASSFFIQAYVPSSAGSAGGYSDYSSNYVAVFR